MICNIRILIATSFAKAHYNHKNRPMDMKWSLIGKIYFFSLQIFMQNFDYNLSHNWIQFNSSTASKMEKCFSFLWLFLDLFRHCHLAVGS